MWGFPGSPVVRNVPSNAGDVGSIPGHRTNIPHASEQLNPCDATPEPTGCTKVLKRCNEDPRQPNK